MIIKKKKINGIIFNIATKKKTELLRNPNKTGKVTVKAWSWKFGGYPLSEIVGRANVK